MISSSVGHRSDTTKEGAAAVLQGGLGPLQEIPHLGGHRCVPAEKANFNAHASSVNGSMESGMDALSALRVFGPFASRVHAQPTVRAWMRPYTPCRGPSIRQSAPYSTSSSLATSSRSDTSPVSPPNHNASTRRSGHHTKRNHSRTRIQVPERLTRML